jgi:hypothetical protein
MNERTKQLLAGFEAEPGDLARVAALWHPPFVVTRLDPLRRWLGVPGDPLNAIGVEFLQAIFGHGKGAALAIFAAWSSETLRTDSEAAEAFDALRRLARQSRIERAIWWDLDAPGDKPDAAQKPRLLVLTAGAR